MNIVITGASSGIGEALALHYARSGVTLGITGRDAPRLKGVAAACSAKGAHVDAQIIDVADRAAMRDWLGAFDDAHAINLLIVNAGIGGGGAKEPTFERLEAAQRMFAVNINGVANTIDPILPRMAKRRSGQIAMMASLAGFRGLAGAPAYAASKGFVKLYGEGLRGSLAPHGVKINVICPGFVESRITFENAFHMPFLMRADEAARIIAKGLQKNKARIAFPWPLVFGAWLLSALPASIADRITRYLPQKN